MKRHLSPRSIVRANWLAELSSAIDDGERLLAELIAEQFCPQETERLRLRLIELRGQLDRLNRVSLTEGRVVGPAWPESATADPGAAATLHPDWLPRRD